MGISLYLTDDEHSSIRTARKQGDRATSATTVAAIVYRALDRHDDVTSSPSHCVACGHRGPEHYDDRDFTPATATHDHDDDGPSFGPRAIPAPAWYRSDCPCHACSFVR